ncbi:MAG TPA: YdeI/OmpD-associated family protein [Bacteroidota bacterium]|nr:YdeI/OmpD-associated family protein [Bacteroidota bacterium]
MTKKSPGSFASPAAFRAWLKKNHAGTDELIVRLYRVHAADRGITYRQALDEALCFGWIDGVRRSLDTDSFTIRFSPRKPRSIWSLINVAHVKRLIASGRMTRPGLLAFRARDSKRTGVYSFEQRPSKLSPAHVRKFRRNRKAWDFFQDQAPWYRRTSSFWVMNAKREETREKRLDLLIACSARGKPIPALAWGRKPGR